MIIDIKELLKIKLEKGDVLVVKIDRKRGSLIRESLLPQIFSELFPNNKVILADHEDSFKIIKQEILK